MKSITLFFDTNETITANHRPEILYKFLLELARNRFKLFH